MRSDASLGPSSPDGRYVPFFSGNDARGQLLADRELFVHDGLTGQVRRLTASAGTNEAAPGDATCVCVYSQDGQQLAYVWWTLAPRGERGSSWWAELRVLRPAETGIPQPRVVFPGGDDLWLEPYGWTPDGRWIAAQLYDRSTDTARIALLPTGEGSPRILKALKASRLNGRLAISPDGRYLAAMVREATTLDYDILVFDLRTDQESGRLAQPGNDVLVGWTPTGQRLVFTSDQASTNDLWIASVIDGQPNSPQLLRAAFGEFRSLGLTSTGRLLYQRQPLPSQRIAIDSVNVDAGSITLSQLDSDDRSFDRAQVLPAWSRDGEYLAYVLGSERPKLVYRRVAQASEQAMQLPMSRVENLQAAPTGEAIAIAGADVDGDPVAYLAFPETGVLSPLGPYHLIHGWSATGRSVFLGSVVPGNADSSRIVEHTLDSGVEREVYRGLSGPRNRPALSPDGSILFLRRPGIGGSPDALIGRDLASGNERTLATSVSPGPLNISAAGRYLTSMAQDGSGSWIFSTNGDPVRFLRGLSVQAWGSDDRDLYASSLAFIPGRLGSTTLWRVDATSLVRHRIDEQGGAQELLWRLIVSPDGQRLVRVLIDPIGTYSTTQGRVSKEVWELPLFERGLATVPPAVIEGPSPIMPVTVRVSTVAPRPLEPGFAGYNVALMVAGIPYASPQLTSGARRLHPGWLRYPAGARAGAFDWRTGTSRAEWVEQFRGTSMFGQVQDAFDVLTAKGGEMIDDAFRLSQAAGASGLIVTVNVFTDTPASAGALAAYARAHGIRVLAWELGNEPTFFPTFFTDANDYAAKMRPYADAIRAADPDAKLALSLSIAGIPTTGWDSTLAAFRPRYWDMLGYHQYPRLRAGVADLMAALNEILANETDGYATSIVKLFGSMPLIVTEAAPGSGNGLPPGSSMAGTLYGGIWAAEYAMRMATVPQMKHVGMHQLLGLAGLGVTDDHLDALLDAANAGTRLDPAVLDYGLYLSGQGVVYGTAAGVLNTASVAYNTRVAGGSTVSLHSPGQNMPAVYAQAYRTGPTMTILLTNKGAGTERVNLFLDGSAVHTPLHLLTVSGPAPDARNTARTSEVAATESTASGRITLPPYSLTRISFPLPSGK